ncbi:hypothetical protein DFH27DRAFT_549012 [Peziza echinospora]|nr:hypothetical protein DFH27DRAFT_549012 [Peziza echinospora]
MGNPGQTAQNTSNGFGGRKDPSQFGNLSGAGASSLRIDTGPLHQQQQSNNTADSGPPTTQDSLSLGQLKKLVSEGVKAKPPEYAFTYTDTDILPNELNDFFTYDRSEMDLVLAAKDEFDNRWTAFCSSKRGLKKKQQGSEPERWRDAAPERRQTFVARYVDSLESSDQDERVRGLEVLSHVAQGVFGEATSEHDQLYWIVENAKLLRKSAAIDSVFQVLRGIMSQTWDNIYLIEPPPLDKQLLNLKELRHSLLILYFIFTVYVPSALADPATSRNSSASPSFLNSSNFHRPPLYQAPTSQDCDALRDELADIEPLLLPWLIKTISQTRWQDDEKQKDQIPLQQLLLLTWKAIIVTVGSIKNPKHLAKTKSWARVREGLSKRVDKKMITASPLDYHNFRQDILAKYPAYNPPPAVNGFEIEGLKRSNNSSTNLGGQGGGMLGGPYDGLSGNHCTAGANGILGGTTSSIINQPVHIATPAPSPPPSPAGTKGAKKQNYQTNQNFPFLYPPPNSSANSVWGKVEVGGLDAVSVPESILEAGDLFQKRIRMTLAMRQLWKEREEFLRHERGWAGGLGLGDDLDELSQRFNNSLSGIDGEPTEICMEERRLKTVEDLYRHSLANLQSFIIVCLKVVLQNLCIALPAPPSHPDDRGSPKRYPDGIEEADVGASGETSRDDGKLNALRETEIMSKAVAAIFLMLLKWFRVSHVLKFEYLTQLLLDTSYLPLLLRILGNTEVATIVNTKTDHKESSFLHFCKLQSAAPEQLDVPSSPSPTDIDDSDTSEKRVEDDDSDEAVPPPIKFHDQSIPPPAPPPATPPPLPPTSSSETTQSNLSTSTTNNTENYNPNTEFGAKKEQAVEVITDFSWRNFFTVINYLRIMQKICKGKAHRNLLLVQYKSSPTLRKALKCSQDEMRLYTLKLFKGQVPYCGRKWRQGNMKVITGIYLHCRPELRDDWLAGSDVDAEVEEALPQEHAIRALTSFFNIQRYPQGMGADEEMLNEERDFFARELEKMQVLGINSMGNNGAGEMISDGNGAAVNVSNGFGGGLSNGSASSNSGHVPGNVGGSGTGGGSGDVVTDVGTWEMVDDWGEMAPI